MSIKIAGVGTHMHWVGQDMKIDIERVNPPAGQPEKECLLQTPRWDFNWQRSYIYDTPIEQLPRAHAGDRVNMRCRYNNSMSNPFLSRALQEQGMTAPVDVRLGEETLEEMCLGLFVVLLP